MFEAFSSDQIQFMRAPQARWNTFTLPKRQVHTNFQSFGCIAHLTKTVRLQKV